MFFKSQKMILFAAAVCGLSLAAGENLLCNPQWEGNPVRQWRGGLVPVDGVVTVKEKESFWQPFETAKPGHSYRLTAEVKGVGSEFRFCGFWPAKENGKTVSRASDNWRKRTASASWQKIETVIHFDKAPVRCPYLSLSVTRGSVETRSWFLEELSAEEASALAANLLKNPRWEDNSTAGWRGEKLSVKNGVATVTADAKPQSLWQPFEAAQKGEAYRMTAEIKGSADSEFRFCGYWPAKINGKNASQCSDNWRWLKGNGEWQKVETTIRFPECAVRCPYLTLTVRKGSVEVRNWSIVKLPPPEKPSPALGGIWKLHEKSRVGAEKDAPQVKYPEIPEISIHVPGAELQNAAIEPGKNYQLDFEVIGRGDSGTGTGFHGFRVEVMAENGKSLYRVPWQDVWNTSWQKKSIRLKSIPAQEKHLSFRLYAQGKGFVAFRNFALKTYQTAPFENYAIRLTSPGYRNAVYATQPVIRIEGSVIADARMKSGTIRLLKGPKELAKQQLGADGAFFFASVPEEPGEYQLCAELKGADGKPLTALTAPLYRYARAPHEFLQGKDRNFYMDGKPVLPVLFMTTPGDEECMRAAAAAGFTGHVTLAGSESAAKSALEQGKRCGQKVILGIRYCEDGDLAAWKKRVAAMLTPELLAHEALLGYFLADEPLWVGANLHYFTESAAFLRQHDPFHPVWMNSAPLSTIEENRPYCKAVDINGIDIYPIPYPASHSSLADKYPTCVGKYARTMYETTDQQKSIWMVLQGTSWGSLGPQYKGAYPTLSELRFMIYDALFNTANGIVFWGTQRVTSAAFFRDLRTAAGEVYALAPALLEGTRTALSSPEGTALYQVQFAGKNYFLALNNSKEKRQAELSLGVSAPEVSVLHEQRSLPCRAGKISDEFAPFSCHWYSADALPETKPLPVYQGKEDPFDRLCRKRNSVPEGFRSAAFWIWEKKTVQKQGGSAWVAKNWDLAAVPRSAKLLVGADDHCEIFVNGRRVGSHSSWSQIKAFDVLPFLKAGENRILVRVSDSGHLPCGFLAELRCEMPEGTKKTLVSDAGWTGSEQKDGPFAPVAVLAPCGEGAWGKRVRFEE